MSSVIGGLSKLPLAKILDTWGRPQGLTLTVVLWVIGIIMMAACNSVEMYAAAQVFSAVGFVTFPRNDRVHTDIPQGARCQLLSDNLYRRYLLPTQPSPYARLRNISLHRHNMDRRAYF